MTKPGCIRITDKGVQFEYYELPKPNLKDYKDRFGWQWVKFYNKAVNKYRISKQEVEVSNVIEHLIPYLDRKDIYRYYDIVFDKNNFEQIKDNQLCEAEVENGIALISAIFNSAKLNIK